MCVVVNDLYKACCFFIDATLVCVQTALLKARIQWLLQQLFFDFSYNYVAIFSIVKIF